MSTPPRLQEQFAAYDWQKAHRAEIQMRYGDLDTMGHLNNAVYVQYLETGRLLLRNDLKISEASDRSVIARLELDYAHEIKYGQQVIIETLIERLGSTSWTLVSRITADGLPCAFARTVQVAVAHDLRPRPIPQEYRERLQALMVQALMVQDLMVGAPQP